MRRLTIALLIISLPVLIFAQPKEMMPPGGKGMEKSMEFCQNLNLSDAQKEQLHQLRLDHQKKVIPLQADLKLAQLELDELINTGADVKKIDAAIKKVNDIKSQLFELKVKHQLAFRNVMTDEQRKLLQQCEADNHPGVGRKAPDKMRSGHRPRMFHAGDDPGVF
jgi:Spy/CpxP family protein refolding chaperone